jgi:hypothetical protein
MASNHIRVGMKRDIQALIERLDASELDVFWYGPGTRQTIEALEGLFGHSLPPSYRVFLELAGGGGVEESEISGIVDGEPHLQQRGGAWWDTMYCREHFALPPRFIVIFFADDEVCWCLDTARPREDGELPVIAYDVFSRKPDRQIAPDFLSFFREYVELRATPETTAPA